MSFQLFDLVPAIYRVRDAQIAANMQLLTAEESATLISLQNTATALSAGEQVRLDELAAKAARGPLQSLLMVIDEQLNAFAADLDQLYDDQFIETCAPWVIPYIGDLISYESIRGITAAVDNPRAEVANTIGLRRRKGTILVIEELARDITGWGAHAIEFFRILADTQYIKHVRIYNHFAPDVHNWQLRAFRNNGFSTMSRNIDVRNMSLPGLPHPNVQNIGIYLWSLGAYSVTKGTPTPCATNAPGIAGCFRLSSLGIDQPLFHRAIFQGDRLKVAATEENVPDRLSRHVLCADMQKGAGAKYYGEGASLAIYIDGQLLNPYQIQVTNLAGDDGSWNNTPTSSTPYSAVLDPDLGRIALPPIAAGANPSALTTSWHFGFNAPMGGGEYERASEFVVTDEAAIFQFPDNVSPARYVTLQDAFDFVIDELTANPQSALEIVNSGTYSVSGGALHVDLPAGTTVEVRAKDETRSTVLLDGELSVSGDVGSSFAVNGLLIAAGVGMNPGASPALLHIPANRPDGSANRLEQLRIGHSTLVPGWAVHTTAQQMSEGLYPGAPVIVAEPPGVSIDASSSILGGIRVTEFITVRLTDSIVDATSRSNAAYVALNGTSGGGPLTLNGCTVVGRVHTREITLVSNSIIWALPAPSGAPGLISDRLQVGCVRFSYLPIRAITPRRFKCVEEALASAQPLFFSTHYGYPAYCKLLACTDPSIRRGADDGGEMGCFHFVLAPLRESDLTIRLQEYMPVSLSAGIIYET
jgi:hypothetical protein